MNFPTVSLPTPAELVGALVSRMLEWLFLRVQRSDQGQFPVLTPDMRARTLAIRAHIVVVWTAFERLARLAAAGRLRRYPGRASPRLRDAPSPSRATPLAGAGRVRQVAGWMLDFVPAEFAAGLGRILRFDVMAALIRTSPQVARLLRPLCRDLGVVPPEGVFPPLPRRARKRRRAARSDEFASDEAAPVRSRRLVAGVRRDPRACGGPAGDTATPRRVERGPPREAVRRT